MSILLVKWRKIQYNGNVQKIKEKIKMFEKLEDVEKRYEELTKLIADKEVI